MLPIRKELFWDTKFENIHAETHQRLIIERVLTLGNLNEFRYINQVYSKQAIIDIIIRLGYLDPKTLSFVVSFFGISKKTIRCYTKKQSTSTRWN